MPRLLKTEQIDQEQSAVSELDLILFAGADITVNGKKLKKLTANSLTQTGICLEGFKSELISGLSVSVANSYRFSGFTTRLEINRAKITDDKNELYLTLTHSVALIKINDGKETLIPGTIESQFKWDNGIWIKQEIKYTNGELKEFAKEGSERRILGLSTSVISAKKAELDNLKDTSLSTEEKRFRIVALICADKNGEMLNEIRRFIKSSELELTIEDKIKIVAGLTKHLSDSKNKRAKITFLEWVLENNSKELIGHFRKNLFDELNSDNSALGSNFHLDKLKEILLHDTKGIVCRQLFTEKFLRRVEKTTKIFRLRGFLTSPEGYSAPTNAQKIMLLKRINPPHFIEKYAPRWKIIIKSIFIYLGIIKDKGYDEINLQKKQNQGQDHGKLFLGSRPFIGKKAKFSDLVMLDDIPQGKNRLKIISLLAPEESYSQNGTALKIGDAELINNETKLKNGIERNNFPVFDHGFTKTDGKRISYEDMTKLIDEIHGDLAVGKNVYVHCWAGISRSATVVMSYFIKHQSMTVLGAIEHVSAYRQATSMKKLVLAQKAFLANFFMKTLKDDIVAKNNFHSKSLKEIVRNIRFILASIDLRSEISRKMLQTMINELPQEKQDSVVMGLNYKQKRYTIVKGVKDKFIVVPSKIKVMPKLKAEGKVKGTMAALVGRIVKDEKKNHHDSATYREILPLLYDRSRCTVKYEKTSDSDGKEQITYTAKMKSSNNDGQETVKLSKNNEGRWYAASTYLPA